jgi:acyl-CoA synthetase (NDP forming)
MLSLGNKLKFDLHDAIRIFARQEQVSALGLYVEAISDPMAEKFSAFLAEDFDVTLCVLDYPREDLCDQSTWGGAERGFVQATHRTGAKTGVLSTFSDNMWESVAERLIKEGIVPLAGIDTGLAGLQAAVDVGAAWSRDLRQGAVLPRVQGSGMARGAQISSCLGSGPPTIRADPRLVEPQGPGLHSGQPCAAEALEGAPGVDG